ncbi:MAG: hypothetical protein ACE5EC_04560, partial [Phycisphaerae bacterium]
MRKKIILGASVFFFLIGAFYLFSYRDRAAQRPSGNNAVEAVRRFVSSPTSQEARPIRGSQLPLSPGDEPRIVVYDEITHRRKYQLEAEKWEPDENGTGFHVEELQLQIFMPRGEITHISADEADITVAKKSRNRIEAQRGTLKGHVKVIIDRTTEAWRQENPTLAARESHPDDLITIDMESAQFDMERSTLLSQGSVVVDSADARIEQVKELSVHWDEVDNRIETLRFAQGGRMVLRRGAETIDFALPGTERRRKPRGSAGLAGTGTPPDQAASGPIPRAQANRPISIESITASQAAEEIRLAGRISPNQPVSLDPVEGPSKPHPSKRRALRSREELSIEMERMKSEARTGLTGEKSVSGRATLDDILAPRKKKVHTYKAKFNNQVVVEQMADGRRIGELKADKLEVHFDFGSRQRMMAGPRASVKKTPAEGDVPGIDVKPKSQDTKSIIEVDPRDSQSEIILTWNGPLELQPIPMDPIHQTGKRFDVIAIGMPVEIWNEQGRASCTQLVYRSEPRQIWLSGDEPRTVEMSLSGGQILRGREVFFDQKRGLGRVDGAGRIHDTGSRSGAIASAAGNGSSAKVDASPDGETDPKPRDPVTIRWSRGVDLEVGRRVVKRIDPKTGLLRDKEKEYLRRAWFHGDVFFDRGDEQLNADEVAATFFVPSAGDAVSEQIEHLNMSGTVRFGKGDRFISADLLDVELLLTPAGRSVPRIVDAEGKAIVRQDQREIRGESLHVVLGQYPGEVKPAKDGNPPQVGKPRLGVETLDASGDVLVLDPEHNLKISRAETLRTKLRNGNELVRAVVVSPSPDVMARARFGNMAVHGHRIEMDMDRETIDVPGPGKGWMARDAVDVDKLREPTPAERALVGGAWMLTRRKLGLQGPLSPLEDKLVAQAAGIARGKIGPQRSPGAMRMTWTGGMQMRLARNYGVVVGQVYARQEGLELRCDKLTIRFTKEKDAGSGNDKGRRSRAGTGTHEGLVVRADRRRPAYIIAEGHAKAFSSDYAPSGTGDSAGRLLSRIYIGGDQIVADLEHEQMSVPCSGSLLIEDYQIERRDGGVRRSAQDARM